MTIKLMRRVFLFFYHTRIILQAFTRSAATLFEDDAKRRNCVYERCAETPMIVTVYVADLYYLEFATLKLHFDEYAIFSNEIRLEIYGNFKLELYVNLRFDHVQC